MSKIVSIFIGLIHIQTLLIQTNGQTATTTLTNICQPQTFFNNFANVTVVAPANIITVCQPYFKTLGGCVTSDTALIQFSVTQNLMKTVAINALNFGAQFINATVYFQRKGGFINSTSTLTQTTSFIDALKNVFVLAWNNTVGFFNLSVAWIQSIFSTHVNSVNKCLQAYANLTYGAFCTVSSNYAFKNDTSTDLPTHAFVRLKADQTSTGVALNDCLPLIDTYCSITWGISISNSSLPFNNTLTTFDDGGLTNVQCTGLKNAYNGTTETDKGAKNKILTELYVSNWVRFVPTADIIANLGSFYNKTDTTVAYVPILQKSPGKGIIFSASIETGAENYQSNGMQSGAPVVVFSSYVLSCKILLVFVYAMLERF